MSMTVKWLGHSCFRVEAGGSSVVLDPFSPGSLPGCRAIADAVQARTVIPMHYRSDRFGFDVIGAVEDFLALCDPVRRLDSDTLTVEPGMPRETVVLTYI